MKLTRFSFSTAPDLPEKLIMTVKQIDWVILACVGLGATSVVMAAPDHHMYLPQIVKRPPEVHVCGTVECDDDWNMLRSH